MQQETINRQQIVFISGRFRSGTSMLWNIFNQLPNYCAFYEPLHPNLLSHIQFVKPKEDHIGIDDYWLSYSHLNKIDEYYSPEFGQKSIYLEKHDKYDKLKKYIQYLIDNPDGKTPVLQFNRIDLRLSWIKNNFPNASIITIEREPFALWKSSRRHIKNTKHKVHEGYPDAYDLMQWSVELAKYFPMLQAKNNRNGYYRHYFIWKLTQQLAKANANLMLSLENDFLHTHNGISTLARLFNWNNQEIDSVENLIKKPASMHKTLDKEQKYTEIEENINEEFKQLGLTKLFPSNLLSNIKQERQAEWAKYSYHPDRIIQELLDALTFQKDELTSLLN